MAQKVNMLLLDGIESIGPDNDRYCYMYNNTDCSGGKVEPKPVPFVYRTGEDVRAELKV